MGKGPAFSIEEDRQLCWSWLHVSQELVSQAPGQKPGPFWIRINEHFHEQLKARKDKMKDTANTRKSSKPKKPEHERSRRSLQNRWALIQHDVHGFCESIKNVIATSARLTDEHEILNRALDLYSRKYPKPFQFMHCWAILKEHPQWVQSTEKKSDETTPRHNRTSSPSAGSSTSNAPRLRSTPSVRRLNAGIGRPHTRKSPSLSFVHGENQLRDEEDTGSSDSCDSENASNREGNQNSRRTGRKRRREQSLNAQVIQAQFRIMQDMFKLAQDLATENKRSNTRMEEIALRKMRALEEQVNSSLFLLREEHMPEESKEYFRLKKARIMRVLRGEEGVTVRQSSV